MRRYNVYMIRCADDSYYIGVTNAIERRFAEHADGLHKGCFTYPRRPLVLVYTADFGEITEAIAWEKKIKKWSRKKKEALIRGEYETLPTLSACMNATHHDFYERIACHAERSRSATRGVIGAVMSIPRLRSG